MLSSSSGIWGAKRLGQAGNAANDVVVDWIAEVGLQRLDGPLFGDKRYSCEADKGNLQPGLTVSMQRSYVPAALARES